MKSPARRVRALRRRFPSIPRYGYQPLPFPVPEELLRIKTWKEGMAEFEEFFGISTEEAMRLHVAGQTPQFRDVAEERTFARWLSAIRLAVDSGLLKWPQLD